MIATLAALTMVATGLIAGAATRTSADSSGDATSGIDTIEYRPGDGEWTVYDGAIDIDVTAQTIAYRATDLAGNVSAALISASRDERGRRRSDGLSSPAHAQLAGPSWASLA